MQQAPHNGVASPRISETNKIYAHNQSILFWKLLIKFILIWTRHKKADKKWLVKKLGFQQILTHFSSDFFKTAIFF